MATGAVPFGVYAIVQVKSRTYILMKMMSNASQKFNLPIQLQPQFFGFLTLICWGQSLVYHKSVFTRAIWSDPY